MSYMGRGKIPNIGYFLDYLKGNNQESNYDNDEDEYQGPRFERYFRRHIVHDNTYILMQITAALAIFIMVGITFLFTYKSQVADPIENVKNLFLNSHIITITIIFVLMILINYITKSKNDVIKRLILIFIFSVIIMAVFVGVKVHFDSKYDSIQFAKIYDSEIDYKTFNNKNRYDLTLGGVKIKSDKNYYVDECMKMYNLFQIKAYGILGVHIWINLFLFLQILKLIKQQEKKDRLNKDDKILFDEEQNCRY